MSAQTPAAGFHHIHLNSTDPAKAIDWYLKTFPVTSKATVAGFNGLASERIHVLFSTVKEAPSAALDSAIWHFGWGTRTCLRTSPCTKPTASSSPAR